MTGVVDAQGPAATRQGIAPALAKVASFEHQVTGVTVARDGRIFMNFPRWTEETAVSVADPKGNLWVLDPATPAMAAAVKDGPTLVEIDLATNKPARTIAVDETVEPQGS